MSSPFAHHWQLDPTITYLNHGSFGATPTCVLEAQHTMRARMEMDLVHWFVDEHEGAMDRARKALARTLHCPWQDLALVPNATIAVATAFASLVHARVLNAGDEVLVTNHEYPACLNNAQHWAKLAGAQVVQAKLPFPIAHKDDALEAIVRACTPRTRVALVSHVTSSSGLVLPIEAIVRELRARDIRVIVDGAHAPGMLVPGVHGYGAGNTAKPEHAGDDAHRARAIDAFDSGVRLQALAPEFYTANCHKWYCAPKGAAFLYVHPSMQALTRPLALSNNANNPKPGRAQFLTEFDYVGTSDYTPAACIPEAIEFLAGLMPGGMPQVATMNRDLCLRGRNHLLGVLQEFAHAAGGDTTGVGKPTAPDDMVACICTMRLPLAPPHWRTPTPHHDALHDRLYANHRIQVPVWSVPPQREGDAPARSFRIATQLYNSFEQYERLGEALREELRREK
jgi:isopenicillin-N epimerase